MNNCKYCGENNPSTVFNCLKCHAVMPAPPPVQAVTVVQERKPIARKLNANLPKPLPTEMETFKSFAIYMGIAIAIVGLFVTMFFVLNKIQPLPSTSSASTASPEPVSSETGYYLDYKFTLMKKGSDDKVVALFQPRMLPHNDIALIGATRKVISQAYGKEISSDPVLVGKEIKFTSGKDSFYVMPVKEDTGEIHTLVIRR